MTAPRPTLVLAALAALTAAACTAAPTSVAGSPEPVGDSAASAAGTTPAAAAARTLVLPAAVRPQLVAAWVARERVDPSEVSGLKQGSNYYGYVPSSGTFWALAVVLPSDAGAHGRSREKFRNGPWVFSRPSDGTWRLVTGTGGQVCPSVVPAAMLAAWAIATADC